MLFSNTITEIQFNAPDDLKKVKDYLINFNFQGNDKSKIHEFFCIYILLMGTFKINRLNFPIKIVSGESPDFIINSKVGVEHTRATIESFKIAEAELKKHPEGSVIELCYYSPFIQIPKKQSDIGIVHPNGQLTGDGWTGNQPEREWAETVLNTLRGKTLLLNRPHFKIQNTNVLFIEDDSPVGFVKDEDEAIEILKQKYIKTTFSGQHRFDIVHIFSNCTFIYDIFGECVKTSLRIKELPNI